MPKNTNLSKIEIKRLENGAKMKILPLKNVKSSTGMIHFSKNRLTFACVFFIVLD